MSKSAREIAHKSNPLIGQALAVDTLRNVDSMLSFLRKLSTHSPEIHLNPGSTNGLYQLADCCRAALQFEADLEEGG